MPPADNPAGTDGTDEEIADAVTAILANIRAEIARRGLTVESLADQIDGMSAYVLGDRLRNDSPLRVHELLRIARALDTPLATLLHGATR